MLNRNFSSRQWRHLCKEKIPPEDPRISYKGGDGRKGGVVRERQQA